MLNVSEKADEKIKDFFKDKAEPHQVRIFLAQGG